MCDVNYYTWVFDRDKIALDEERKIYRYHSDGSPCYAMFEKDCPIISKQNKADEADDLSVSKEEAEQYLENNFGEHYKIIERQKYEYQKLDKEKDKDIIDEIKPYVDAFVNWWKAYDSAWTQWDANRGNGQLKENLDAIKKFELKYRIELKNKCEQLGLKLVENRAHKKHSPPYGIRKKILVGTMPKKKRLPEKLENDYFRNN